MSCLAFPSGAAARRSETPLGRLFEGLLCEVAGSGQPQAGPPQADSQGSIPRHRLATRPYAALDSPPIPVQAWLSQWLLVLLPPEGLRKSGGGWYGFGLRGRGESLEKRRPTTEGREPPML